MRKFIINVNGNSYEVEVEEVGGTTSAYQPQSLAQPVATEQKAAPATVAKTAAPQGTKTVSSPMPGTIVAVKVSVGDSVKKGDVLCVLESMKMENEIFAPQDGTVASVSVSQGTAVNAGDTLISLA